MMSGRRLKLMVSIAVVAVIVVVVVLTLTRMFKSMVTGHAPVTMEWKSIPGRN